LTDFLKTLNIKLDENLPSGNWVLPYRQMDMTELIAAFRNFANAPTNGDIL
jgi:hypothetical protein